MVFLNGQKLACESCIKGHRSSSCDHTNRPLFEIKKKGRPVSQCEKCRQLRQSKKFHSKCTCQNKSESEQVQQPSTSRSKSKRFVPIVPAYPNGLDSSTRSTNLVPADVRQRVDSLLNPCTCKSIWSCKCRQTSRSDVREQEPSTAPVGEHSQNGLATLACAAALCCEIEPSHSHSHSHSPSLIIASPTPRANPETSQEPKRYASRPTSPVHKRQKSLSPPQIQSVPGPDLPPLLSQLSSIHPLPVFPTIPGIDVISSLAGSGCTCGLRCACPGCVQHRGSGNAFSERADCADGCRDCVDHEGGIALPGLQPSSGSSVQSARSSVFDQFLARAAALPSPPANRKLSTQLDPGNVMIYPPTLFSGTVLNAAQQGVAFGLVKVPRLECCGGNCGCPGGNCGCGKTCNGCCDDRGGHSHYAGDVSSRCYQAGAGSAGVRAEADATSPTIDAAAEPNCCC